MIFIPYTETHQRDAAAFLRELTDALIVVPSCKGCNTPFPHCDCPEPVAAGVVPKAPA